MLHDALLALVVLAPWLPVPLQDDDPPAPGPGSPERLSDLAPAAAELVGLELTGDEVALMAGELSGQLAAYAGLRDGDLDNAVAPAMTFSPLVPGVIPAPHPTARVVPGPPPAVRDDWRADFWTLSIPELGALLRAGRTTCLELTELHLERLAALDEQLHCVVTLLPERARAQARQLDVEAAEGRWRGPLHGIPWGAKDLLAVAGAPTTWGAEPYRDQVLDVDAAAVRRLDAAGAVLIAKLSLGSLAMGDVWFGGTTRNPWAPRTGSSGSSAGSAAAVAAGGVVFALGSETLGSIVSPSVRCGVTSVRPSFGRVSRAGAMALSWSMDKLGPMARSFVDAGHVLAAIAGPDEDELDAAALQPADWPLTSMHDHRVGDLTVGVPAGSREDPVLVQALDELRAALADRGHALEVVDLELPEAPLDGMLLGLMVEAAAAFDGLTRSGDDDRLVRQGADAWPNLFRAARLVPAVEYVNAQRHRTLLVRELEARLQAVDVVVHPPFAGGLLLATNLTGHPTVVAPLFLDGAEEADGTRRYPGPRGICFTGRLYDEGFLLAVADLWQGRARHNDHHPADLLAPAPAGPAQAADGTEPPGDPGASDAPR